MRLFSAHRLEFFNQKITLEIYQGELIVIFGGNGSGKSSLGRLISQPKAQSGLYWHPQLAKKDIGLVEYSAENPRFHYSDYFYQQRYHSFETKELVTISQWINYDQVIHETWLKKIFDPEILDKTLIELSSGETRKVQILSQLFQEKKLYILDQPFVGLDQPSIQLFEQLFWELVDSGKAIIILDTDPIVLHQYHRRYQLETRSLPFLKSDFPVPPPIEADFSNFAVIRDAKLFADDFLLIEELNWTIRKGDKYLLKGPNGSGKSTLCSLLYADHPAAYRLQMELFDRPRGSGESIWEIKKKIGYISPEMLRNIPPHLTVREVILSGFSDTMYLNRKLSGEEEYRYQEFLCLWHIQQWETRPFLSLSNGEKTLVAIARILLKNPPVLILDEPFQGLDNQYFVYLFNLLSSYCLEDRTLIQIAHREKEILPEVNQQAEIIEKRLIVTI